MNLHISKYFIWSEREREWEKALLLTNATKFLFILTYVYAPKVRDRNYLWDMSKFDYKMYRASKLASEREREEEKIHFVKSNN